MECDGTLAVLVGYALIVLILIIVALINMLGAGDAGRLEKLNYVDFVNYVNLLREDGLPISEKIEKCIEENKHLAD